MTKKRARQLLREVWGTPRMMSREEEYEIKTEIRLPNEKVPLDTLIRIAEDRWNWQDPIANHGKMRGHEINREHFANLF